MEPSQLSIAGVVSFGPEEVRLRKPRACSERAESTLARTGVACRSWQPCGYSPRLFGPGVHACITHVAPCLGAGGGDAGLTRDSLQGAQGGGAEVASVDSDSGRVVISAAGRRFGADGTPGAATVAAAAAGQHASRAALLTGLYIAAAGAALFAAPLQTFSLLFSTQLISSGWIQVFGVLCMAFGAYYVGAARAGARGFLQATVYGRLGIFAAFGWLVARGVAEASLLLLGLVNAAGALVMWNAMRRDDGQRAAAPY